MKYLITLFAIMFSACGQAADLLSPPAVPNPLVIGVNGIKVPLCAQNLNDTQFRAITNAFGRWQMALPGLDIPSPRRDCIFPEPRVAVDATALPNGKSGWTDQRGITFRGRVIDHCVATHEVGHWLGLIRHAPTSETGVMSDGDRGACQPSTQDVAILERTYFGRVSR